MHIGLFLLRQAVTNDQFIGRLLERILVLDGAMGTMIMTRNLTEKNFRGERFGVHPMSLMGCNDVLVLTRPDLVYDIHYEYLEAGADIISTDTFNSNRISLAQYALDGYVREICRAGATIARKAVDDYCIEHGLLKERGPLVAGSVGPTRANGEDSISGGVTARELMVFSFVGLKNAPFSIYCNVEGRVRVVRPVARSNAFSPIPITP